MASDSLRSSSHKSRDGEACPNGLLSSDGGSGVSLCNDHCHEQRLIGRHELSCSRAIPSNSVPNWSTWSAQSSKASAFEDHSSLLVHNDHGKPGKSIAIHLPQNVKAQAPKGCTMQDLYEKELYDEEEDEDSDWEPVQSLVLKKWFCVNCTMANFDDVSFCDVCGEEKDSDIFQHDVFKDRHQESHASVSAVSSENNVQNNLPKKSKTAVGFDERMLLHCEVEMKSHPHPERPDRLRAILSSLVAAGIYPGKCFRVPSREITKKELQMVHSLDHVDAIQQTSSMLYSYFTSDTYANEHSACAARLAAGVCADLALLIMSGQAKNGFALVRPPGHHAGVKQAMGFCLHNNAAVAALAALQAGAKRVLIVDWDVHHGNGTQEIFDSNKSVLYVSLHRHEGGRFYPGTGDATEVGTKDGEGFSINIPWSCGGVGDHDYVFAFQHIVLPIAREFSPDITIVSAGFDAARGDPLGCCDVTPDGFSQMTYMLSSISQGKLLIILEGGYNLRSISSSATAVIKVLLGDIPDYDMGDITPSKEGLQTVLQVAKIQLKFWPVLKVIYTALKSEWRLSLDSSGRTGSDTKRRKRPLFPATCKLSKLFFYEMLSRRSSLGSSKGTSHAGRNL